MNKLYLLLILSVFLGCSGDPEEQVYFDGRLETDIIKVSAKTPGNLDSLVVDEGDAIVSGQLLAVVDSERLHLQLQQQKAQLAEISANMSSLNAQNKQIQSQLKLNSELIEKTKDLVKKGAATTQKLDELNTQHDVLLAQVESVKAQKRALLNKSEQLQAGISLTQLNIRDSRLLSPIDGLVLNRYFNNSELLSPGIPVFDLADLANMEATIYVSLARLTNIKVGQPVDVILDEVDENFKGTIRWIASEAEFTPKTILTEETRTSLVYAVKISINNDQGKLKIGMPVRVRVDVGQQ